MGIFFIGSRACDGSSTGILEYENLVSDGDIDWAVLSESLYQETASEDKPAKAA